MYSGNLKYKVYIVMDILYAKHTKEIQDNTKHNELYIKASMI